MAIDPRPSSVNVPQPIEERARTYFDNVHPAHDWHHVERVATMADAIAADTGADAEIVALATVLHDIGRAREDRGEIDDHAAWGARETVDILQEAGYDDETVDAVAHCIRAHRYSAGPEPETAEAKVLSDADNLDAMGAIGIARTFSLGAEYGNPIADPTLPVDADESAAGVTSSNHLQKKILSLKDRMYTEAGKKRAEDRHDFVEAFVERLESELDGGY